MKQGGRSISLSTKGPGLYDITRDVAQVLSEVGIAQGLLTCFIRHTSASLLVQENADPDVLRDLESFMRRLVSPDQHVCEHTTEGPDDMPAHIRSALTQTSLSIPVRSSQLGLGTWQAIYLFEHRDAAHRREVIVHVIGE